MNYEKLYQQMLLLRRFEEKADELYKMGEIAGFCHLYIGQEAIAVGIKALMDKNDYLVAAYREHGHMLMSGSHPKFIMAELLGKKSGVSKGKGGSMHMFDKQNGFFGGHGIVGSSASIGTGLAFSQKYKKTKNITIACFGDGASNQGQVFESYNLAALWNLPVLFVIEDNGYAIGTAKNRACAGKELFMRGEPFGIPGKFADGMDIDEVINAASWGIDYVRNNSKPAIVQFDTYRFKGHSMSDSTRSYRKKDEEDYMKENRDCLNILAEKISLTEEKIEKMEHEIKLIVEDAAQFALSDHNPDFSELYTDVYC